MRPSLTLTDCRKPLHSASVEISSPFAIASGGESSVGHPHFREAAMALQSKLFKDDAKLQACLVNDEAHVTLGSRGDHVGKIQKALDALGDEIISDDEMKSKTYGPSTASAVLSYKKDRKIINATYQTQADNIVGKMTIASLDREMQSVERPPEIVSCTCRWHQNRLV
jgi:hypothetical protein